LQGKALKKLYISFILIFTTIEARENPFFPSHDEENIPIATNKIINFEPLKKISMDLPDSARILQEVSFRYQNLDGSIDTKILKIDKSVDWHIPVLISQNLQSNQDDKTISNKMTNIVSKPDKESEIDNRTNTVSKNTKEGVVHTTVGDAIADFSFIKFFLKDQKSMKIVTSDKMIRTFTITNPHRVVLDFKRDASFLTMKEELNMKYFKSITLGNHDNYYRVVITLDGQYKTNIESLDDSVVITCI
jgi:hypothetical protein